MPIEHFLSGNEKESKKQGDPIAARNKMFDVVLDNLPEFRNHMYGGHQVDPVSFVFRNSIQDGLELSRKAGLSPDEILRTTLQKPMFHLVHKEVTDKSFKLMQKIGVQEDEYVDTAATFMNRFKDKKIKNDFNEKGYVFYNAAYIPRQTEAFDTGNNKEAYESIEDYYREFLPYRAAELKKSHEEMMELQNAAEKKNKKRNGIEETDTEKRARTMNQSMDVLLPKYFKTMEDNFIQPGDDLTNHVSATNMIAQRMELEGGIPKEESIERASALVQFCDMKNSEEKLPDLVMRGGAGFKQTWNLEAARKPVAKIVENMRKKALLKNMEQICDGAGVRDVTKDAYKIIYDPIIGKHIPTREPYRMPTEHECAEEIISMQDAVGVLEKAIVRMPSMLHDAPFDVMDSELNSWLKEDANADLKAEFDALNKKTGNSFDSYGPIEKVIPLFLGSSQEKTVRDYIEAYTIGSRIDSNLLTGIAEYLNDALEGKNKSSLSEKNLAILAAKLREKVNNGVIANSFSRSTRDDLEAGLVLLDAFKNNDVESMAQAFPVKSKQEAAEENKKWVETTRDLFSKSKQAFDFYKKILTDKGEIIMRTMGAKPDQNPDRLAEQLVAAAFPAEYHAYQEKQKKPSRLERLGFGGGDAGLGLMKNRFESLMSGGNVGEQESGESGPQMSVTLDKSYSGMLVTNIVAHNPVQGKWERVHIPVDGDMVGNRNHEHITARQSTGVSGSVIVPTPLGAENIFTNRGVVEKDSLGIVNSPGADGKLESWSYDAPVGHLAPMDVNDHEYNRFLDRLITEGGSAYLEKIPGLPVECQMFLDSVADKSPRDRVSAIQKFVTSHSFYDAYDNPLRDQMNECSVSDRMGYMQERLQQLRTELGDEVPDMALFAGVCADFTVIGEMMLRESGIAAGAAEGYRVTGASFNKDSAHGLNVVVWPDASGKNILCEVDMTPSAVTGAQKQAFAVMGINPISIDTTIEESKKQEKNHIEEAKKNLDAVTAQLDEMNAAGSEIVDLKQFRENLVNYINATCGLEDVYVFKRMIETYKFSPVHGFENDVAQKVAAIGFMQGEYKRWVGDYVAKDDPLERLNNPGNNLMGAFHQCYAQAKLSGEQNQLQAMISSIPEYLHTTLPANHKKLWEYFGKYAQSQK